MAVKYVKDFDFPSSAGFHSGAKGYAKGGAVKAPTRTKSTMKREMTQSNKLSGNGALPRISDMDVNKQSGGAGKKLMPGYKAGGPIKAKKGVYITKADEKVIAQREAEYAATNARIAAEEAKPLNRFKKFAEDTSADVLEGYKSKIKRPVLRAVAKAGPKIEKALYKIPNKRLKLLGLGAGAVGAAAVSQMRDDDEANMKMEDIPVTAIRRTESIPDMEMDDIPVTAIRRTESLSAPMKKAASKSVSAMDAVLAYNKLHNKDFDKSTEKEIRNRFASPSEGGMKSGGKVMAKGGAADMKQDKAMIARHNRLMHPGQKSKLMNGGMVNKYAGGGAVDYPSKSKSDYAKQFKSDYANRRKDMLIVTPDNEDYISGRISGRERQDKAKRDNALNAYANRGKDYIKDKLDDVDVAISKKIGLKERARTKESFREGLKEEGYNTGGKVMKKGGGGAMRVQGDMKRPQFSASKSFDGGKTRIGMSAGKGNFRASFSKKFADGGAVTRLANEASGVISDMTKNRTMMKKGGSVKKGSMMKAKGSMMKAMSNKR